jgi:cytidylate kinase
VIVTFSNQYGCGVLTIARRVAGELGYAFVDRQLPVVVAKRLKLAREVVEAQGNAVPTLGERLLTSLERATPELAVPSTTEPFDEVLLRGVQQAVRDYAARGNVVIVGRGAGALLGARPDVLRIFLHASRQWRIAHVMEISSVDAKTAAIEIDRVDRARAAYLQDWYGLTFGDPSNYDICIDVARFDATHITTMLVAAVKALSE